MHAPTLASKAILLTSSHPFLPTWRVKSNKIYKVVLTRRDKHPATEVLFGYATESYQCLAPVWPRDCFQCFPDSFLHKQTKVWEKRTCSRFDLKLWLPPASEYILHHLHISFVNITGTHPIQNDKCFDPRAALSLAGKSLRSLNRRDDILSISAVQDAILCIISQSANG